MTSPDGPTQPTATAALATGTVDRVWRQRREAERRPCWHRPVVGVLAATAFTGIAGMQLLPGGIVTGLVVFAVLVALTVTVAVVSIRRASHRGHSGTVDELPGPGRPWWRSPAMAGPAAYGLIFLGGITGLFDHWQVIVGVGVVLGCVVARWYPGYETADHVTGPRLEHAPVLTEDAVAAVAGGELDPDVLELLVLQHHTGERRVTWCAEILGTTPEDVRGRVARGRRWLELPATEVHRPESAEWVRLSTAGREALGYL